mmetsp:Transcript_22778/g.42619  ORF Transcript_22778/g.42619 Transcript_22778/m.42619 type:complete len:700 (+) Transcript_22778:540-2639(+)
MRSYTIASAVSLVGLVQGCVPLGGFEFELEQSSADAPLLRATAQGPELSEAERVVLEAPECGAARENLRFYASVAHMAGTAGDLQMAEFTQAKMKEFGLENSEIHELNSLLNYPVSRSLEMIDADGKVLFEAPMSEEELEEDPTSHTMWRNLSFLAYGPSGMAAAPLVFANYGRPEDFDVLKAAGIDVQGKVVITRYGECFRGLKAMNAQQRGAVGVLIYSDPEDDGYAVGEVYPEGPWRPSSSIQRGSAQFNSLCAGDPGRPGVEELCGFKTEELIPQIPLLPISYGDAIPLLKALGGKAVPKAWIGGLKDQIEYTFGPSEHDVRITVNNTFVRTPIWNVITTIKGEIDEPVVIGNHRDAWVFGAADPNSGSTVVLEVARSLGKLVKSGWKPKRTIIIGSWSGEEYGLLGSTGWGEEVADTILKDAVAYINTDVGVSGTKISTTASPSLGRAIARALTKVRDPISGKMLSEVWSNKLGTLGSGSDYTVFLDRLGIPSMDLSFNPENGKAYGVYHSIYDSYAWIERNVDPEYELHVALAKVISLIALDFSESEVVPINSVDLAKALDLYVQEVSHLEHKLDMSSLNKAVETFRHAAEKFEAEIVEASPACANKLLSKLERWFLDNDGLPRRKYFRHVLQAPGYYLGYAAQVLPGVQQAISENNLDLAQELVEKLAVMFESSGEKLLTPCHVDRPVAEQV